MAPQYKEQFGDSFDLGIRIPQAMTDQSYRNDVSPSFVLVLNQQHELCIELWVDYEQPSKREFEDMDRYSLVLRNRQTDDSLTIWSDESADNAAIAMLAIEYASQCLKAEKSERRTQLSDTWEPEQSVHSASNETMKSAWRHIYHQEPDCETAYYIEITIKAGEIASSDLSWLNPTELSERVEHPPGPSPF